MHGCRRAPVLLALTAWLALVGCGGCSRTAPDAAPQPSAASDPADAPSGQGAKPLAADTPAEGGEWYVFFLNGAKVGYERSVTLPFEQDGRSLVRIEGASHMTIKRSGQSIDLDVQFTSVETPDGKLLEFESQLSQGPMPMQTSGRVVGNQLRIETTTKGKTAASTIPWSDEYGGFRAVEESLLRKPMKPGESRSIQALMPALNVVGTHELAARDSESVQLLTGTYDLLRIDTVTILPGGSRLTGALWTDRTGQMFKNRLDAMNIEAFRATRAEALQEAEPAEFDLVRDVKVPLSRPLPAPHETRRVRYRVTLEGADPAAVFVSGPSQEVKSVGPNTVEVTVYAVRPGGPAGNPNAPADPPADEDRQPNNLIQSDYPAVVAKAQEAAEGQTDPWPAAVALERCVKEVIRTPGYSQAFATAAEVIDSGEGDCTEHAVLLAALARARKIPARVAIGLVYKDLAFYYHMWTEMYVDGRWIPMDGTLGRGGVGAAHLKMAHSRLEGATALSSFLPVLQVIGRLKIEILEAE